MVERGSGEPQRESLQPNTSTSQISSSGGSVDDRRELVCKRKWCRQSAKAEAEQRTTSTKEYVVARHRTEQLGPLPPRANPNSPHSICSSSKAIMYWNVIRNKFLRDFFGVLGVKSPLHSLSRFLA